MSVLEWLAVLTSLLGIVFSTRQRRICWLFYGISSLLYGKIFFSIKLYADFLLQIFFFFSSIYGWFHWHHQQKSNAMTVIAIPYKWLLRDVLVAGVISALFGFYLKNYTDDAFPWLDAVLSCYSVVAQFWAARLYKANWYLWIIVDFFYTALFCYRGLWLTAALYSVFMVMAMIGLKKWQNENSAVACD
ncbi:MAG: nicotinamide riboside transporter PnuC [Zymomonas mobilis]|uniref:Nicotinamide riboside transporter PnuC n=1 Tax=Zymomonas mobilis TaxID=542 RepID=A0A542W2S4_ZYMMB|nr:nicotinamide riboside transporter PnuC [Zymomonas mobilis]TQL17882.1 nicotinamide mononucleotide transporter [Zymomonas mobilis]